MYKKLWVFDLDGTLLNTLPTIHYYCNKSLSHFGLRSISEEECKDLCRLSIRHFYHRLLIMGGCPQEQLDVLQPKIRDYDIQSYLGDYMIFTEPFKGITEILDQINQNGLISVVLTNKPHDIAVKLVNTFFGDKICLTIGQTPDSISKPDARSILQISEKLQVEKDRLIYIGDTDVDMQTANNAGVTSIAVTWGYQERENLESYNPDFIINSPEELLRLMNTK